MIGVLGRSHTGRICVAAALVTSLSTSASASEGSAGASGSHPRPLAAYLVDAAMLPFGAEAAQQVSGQVGLDASPAALVAALSANPFRFDVPPEPVNLFIANQKTKALRTTDTPAEARKRRVKLERLIWLRGREDENFANRTKILAARVEEQAMFRKSPELTAVTTGAEFLTSLISASQRGPLTNVVVYGHAAPTALYMTEDRGFYAAVSDVAKSTPLVTGTDEEKEKELRATGARDLGDLEALIKGGAITFAEKATIIFAGCGAAGRTDVEVAGIASRIAELSGATVIASVGPTDQSMARRLGPSKYEYSRVTWVRFVKGSPPKVLQTKTLDILGELIRDRLPKAETPPIDRPIASPVAPQIQYHCAARDMPMSEGYANACGRKSNNEGNTII